MTRTEPHHSASEFGVRGWSKVDGIVRGLDRSSALDCKPQQPSFYLDRFVVFSTPCQVTGLLVVFALGWVPTSLKSAIGLPAHPIFMARSKYVPSFLHRATSMAIELKSIGWS
jgi:hypothetical protein